MTNNKYNPLPEDVEKVVDRLNDLTRNTKTLSPTFLSFWLSSYKNIENSVEFSDRSQPKVKQVITCYNAYQVFLKFHEYNEQCKALLLAKPQTDNEIDLLKWLVKIEPIHFDLWLEQVEYMENCTIDEEKSVVHFKLEFGVRENMIIEDGILKDEGQYVRTNEYNFAVELQALYYTVKLLNETWDLYDQKLEEYGVMDQAVIELYSEDDEVYQNRYSLTYQLQQRGMI